MAIKPVDKSSLTEQVENSIFTYLHENSFKPGDSLPREQDLVEMLQVSRPILREALSRLRMLGILESKKKRGLVISRPDVFPIMQKALVPSLLSDSDKRDLYELRLAIELGLPFLVASKISDEDIAELEKIVTREEDSPANFALYMKSDYEFHSMIYQISGNQALQAFQDILYSFFQEMLKLTPRKNFADRFGDPEQHTHRDLLEAIKTRNSKVINEEMLQHLQPHLTRFKSDRSDARKEGESECA